jgi:hypothetical protein
LYPNGRANKEIIGGVSRHRPDFIIETDDFAIIVEIDEDQHSRTYSYAKDQEDHRNECLIESIGKPIIMIRVNPDRYVSNGDQFSACFSLRNGKLIKIDEEFNRRYDIMVKTIADEIESAQTIDLPSLKVKSLFFNE